MNESTILEPTYQERRQVFREAAKKVDPETVEVIKDWVYTVDPYGLNPTPEVSQMGSALFVRSPGMSHWVIIDDVPDPAREAIWKRVKQGDFNREVDLAPFDIDDLS